jgi:hypothetical protein
MIIERKRREVSMIDIRVMAIALVGVVCGSHMPDAQAQAPFRYRAYALQSSVASVVSITHTREDAIKTLHDRPARIQELEWRAPYVSPARTEVPDPVRDVLFSFYDDQLYEIVITYDRDRMEGLTNNDVIETISSTYGVPLLQRVNLAQNGPPADMPADTTVVAQWDDGASLLTLTRNNYAPQFRLVLISKTLHPRARAAIKEALRLDTQEAPQRDLDRRANQAADAEAARQKARTANKAAFKP